MTKEPSFATLRGVPWLPNAIALPWLVLHIQPFPKPSIQGFLSRFPASFSPHTSRLCLKTCINKTKSLHHRVSAPGPKWVCECFSRATMGLYIRPTVVLGHPRRLSSGIQTIVPAWRRPGLETGLGTSSLGIDTGGGGNFEFSCYLYFEVFPPNPRETTITIREETLPLPLPGA